MSGTATPGQDPSVTDAAVAQPDPGQGAGPWADQLASTFEDQQVREQVDAFLRGNVQPYVTQLEQSRNPDADALYQALNDSPGETFLAISSELWGDDAAEAIREALVAQSGDETPPPAETPPAADTQQNAAAPAPPAAGLDPRVERVVTSFEETERQRQYTDALAAFKQDGHSDVVDELFAPFVATAGGDFDTAYAGYTKWLADFKSTAGVPADNVETPAVPEAPQVLGSDSQATTAPPVTKQYGSLDEAIDDFMSENRSSAPTPVGST